MKWHCLAFSGLIQLHNFSQKKCLIAHHICLNFSRMELLSALVYTNGFKNPIYSIMLGMITNTDISIFSIWYESYVG